MWKITDNQGNETTIAALRKEYPELVAWSGYGAAVDCDNDAEFQAAANSTYAHNYARILFWANEGDSEDDPGVRAVAQAVPKGEE